jgi:hypothetical protein
MGLEQAAAILEASMTVESSSLKTWQKFNAEDESRRFAANKTEIMALPEKSSP